MKPRRLGPFHWGGGPSYGWYVGVALGQRFLWFEWRRDEDPNVRRLGRERRH